jgi:putative SOS response-associated peptidase YedK
MYCSVASGVAENSRDAIRVSAKIGTMCSNYAVWLSQQALAEEYAESIDVQLFPYRPTKAGAPAKPYNMAPAIIREDTGRRSLLRMRWGLGRSSGK